MFNQVQREQNTRADALSKMALLSKEQRPGVMFELMSNPSVKTRAKPIMTIEQRDLRASIIAFLKDEIVHSGITLQ